MDSPALTLRSLKGDAQSLTLEWTDGVTQQITWRTLRDNCPCAHCKTKRAEPAPPANPFNILKPAEAAPLKATSMKPTGNYAYSIDFSDGHNSGIYSLEYLRELGDRSAAQS